MSDQLEWFKSGYSDTSGGNCLEVSLNWHKSSYSDTSGGACVEVASCPQAVHIRDSKRPTTAPRLDVSSHAWTDFVAAVTDSRL